MVLYLAVGKMIKRIEKLILIEFKIIGPQVLLSGRVVTFTECGGLCYHILVEKQLD